MDVLAAAEWGTHWELASTLCYFSKEFVEDYVAALGHASPLVRRAAAGGLQRLGSDALPAAPAVLARLNDPDPEVREQVMFALMDIGEGVIPALQEIRAHGPGHLRSHALTALLEVGGETALSAEDRAAIDRLIRIKLLDERAESVGETRCGVLLAVPGGDQQAIMEALDPSEPRPATMRLGFDAISSDRHGGGTRRQRDSRVFVTPQLDGWTLVVGSWYARWAELGSYDFLKLEPATEIEVVRELSARFGQAQSYWYDGELKLGGWLICVDGEVRRWYHESHPEEAIGDRLPVEASFRLPHETAQIPDEERAALKEFWGEEYYERLREVHARYGIPPRCAPFDIAAAMSVSPTTLGPQTEVVGHGLLALTQVGREHGVPTRGAFPI